MESTDSSGERKTVAARRIPAWAAEIMAGLARDQPAVVTRADLAERLREAGNSRSTEATIRELRRLGWLVRLAKAGTWAFVPPGHDGVADPYIALRSWQAADPTTGLHLAGEAAAWHLGYLDRAPHERVRVWLPPHVRLPDGLRAHVRTVRIPWRADQAADLGPSPRLLLRRRLDLLSWAAGLPAFGPEALIVQLASRPACFSPWVDLVAHLTILVEDCDDRRLKSLLGGQSTAAWQRAAYLLHAGGHPQRGIQLFDARPPGPVPKTQFDTSREGQERPRLYVAQYGLIDRLVAPLQGLVGKA